MLSIIIAAGNRQRLLKKCLNSIKKSNLPGKYEIIIVTSSNNSFIKEENNSLLLNIKLIFTPDNLAGSKRNKAIRMAEGDILYFLDDDVTVSNDIFVNAMNIFNQNPGISVIGGPNITPDDDTLFQKASGYFLESIFGTFVMRNRYRVLNREIIADEKSLILCNLAVRKKVFDKENICFNDNVSCNEENILLQELSKRRHKMLYSPKLIVYHTRRKGLFGFCSQIAKYGRGRMQNIKVNPTSFSPLFLIPVFFAAYLVLLPFLSNKAPFYDIPFMLYFVLDLIFSLYYSFKGRNVFMAPFMMVLFPAGHLSYAVGFVGEVFNDKKYNNKI